MKNQRRGYFLAFVVLAFATFSLIPSEAFSQKKSPEQTLAAFPGNVSGIFKNSCVGCHSDMSRGKAKEFMNFSEWDKLTAKKQRKEGKTIAKIVKKGAMPPEEFLKRKPEAALTPAQVTEIVNWAHSIPKK